jgi:hypothetical protein
MTDRGTRFPFASDVAPPPELQDRIRAAVSATPAARSGTRRRVAVALAVAPLIAAVALVVATRLIPGRPLVRLGLRIDAGAEPSHLLIVLVMLAALTLAATWIAVARGSRGLGAGVALLVGAAALVTPVYAALSLGGSTHPGELGSALHLSPWGLPCLYVATTVGLLVLASFTAALRRAAPVASRQRGAAIGAAAGAWAGLTVFVFCPAGEVPHLLVGHVLPIAAFTLLGLAVAPRALRP